MSLQLILGGSGSGKSTYLYEQLIRESENDRDRMFIIIVPEQYTLATQRLLVRLHPRHSLMNIEILSFERLSLRVFDELGVSLHTVLGETGKSLTIRHIASSISDKLPVFKSKLKKEGFVNEVKSLISELSLYHISPEELLENSTKSGLSDASIKRITEISLIYREFLDRIEESYITAEQILELLIPVVEDSAMVRGSV
ncbi:MAG: hypothetical protein J6N76_03540, partial [Lachnospiraceae bacterium]|nr:hypothetical protein [Lachnospiraceae bacterium]